MTVGMSTAMNSTWFLRFFVLVSDEMLGQGGSDSMGKFEHSLLLPSKCTIVEFANIPLVGIGPSKLLKDRSSWSNIVKFSKNSGTLPDKSFRERFI